MTPTDKAVIIMGMSWFRIFLLALVPYELSRGAWGWALLFAVWLVLLVVFVEPPGRRRWRWFY